MSEEGLDNLAKPLIEAVENAEPLDPVGERVGRIVRDLLPAGKVKDAISGVPLGHALHPLLTDVVIGSWVSATTLDLLGGDRDGTAARRLIAVGIASYPPTALTGASDYADSELFGPEIRRAGVAHALANSMALGLYGASYLARRKGRHGRGKLLGLLGAGALAVGGQLGGHMSYRQGLGVDQTIFDPGPEDWQRADAGDVPEGQPSAVNVGDTPVLLVRQGGSLHAIHDRCSHRGCLLSEGTLDGDVIECKCHGSRFRLADGSVERGPATAPQPAYEARERDGAIEIKLG